jgi:replicative superfamily II helicase
VVDFKKLRKAKAKPKPINPREIFNALPKPLGINDLYAGQAEALDNWFAGRTDKEVVVKLHTGGGKTLVALLMAQSVAWHRKLAEVQDYLSQQVEDIDAFIWPFLRDSLAYCHCLFSRGAVAISTHSNASFAAEVQSVFEPRRA